MVAMEQTTLSVPARIEGDSPKRAFTASVKETQTEEVCDPSALAYLNDEFPSQRAYVYSSISNSLGRFFVSFLPQDRRIRDVLWAFEPPFLRIWTVIDEPDFEFEKHIYEAEKRFLDKVDDDYACDFTVIYASGRPIGQFQPTGAVSVK